MERSLGALARRSTARNPIVHVSLLTPEDVGIGSRAAFATTSSITTGVPWIAADRAVTFKLYFRSSRIAVANRLTFRSRPVANSP